MRRLLIDKYPAFKFCKDAMNVVQDIKELGFSSAACIVSGLPFWAFAQEVRDRILDEIEASLKEDGLFITFQYSLQMKNQLQKRFRKVEIHFVSFNFLPAYFILGYYFGNNIEEIAKISTTYGRILLLAGGLVGLMWFKRLRKKKGFINGEDIDTCH